MDALLFDFALPAVDPATVSATGAPREARERLSAQCQAILDLLTARPRTNAELARVVLKYTSRISDLRAAGHEIEAFDQDHKTGLAWYRLVTR